MLYDTAEYANQRLQETIVRHNGFPCKVVHCANDRVDIITSHIVYLHNRKDKIVPFRELDLTPVPLGFANGVYGVSYLARISLRKDWKQGLRSNTLRSLFGVDPRWIDDKSLSNTIMGKYPTFDKAMEEAVNSNMIVAFTRDFAVGPGDNAYNLYYKYYGKVGTIVNNIPLLDDGKDYLIQVLEGAMKEA